MLPAPMSVRLKVIGTALVFAIAVAVPAVAWAAGQGSSPATPTPMALPAHMSGKLVTVPGADDDEYWYVVHLSVGQTLSATLTASSITKMWGFMLSADQDDEYAPILSDTVSSHVENLSFEAAHTGDYFLSLSGSKPGTFTVNAALAPARKFTMSSLSVPTSAKPNTVVSVSVKITPGYNSPTSPLRFYLDKKTKSGWSSSSRATAYMKWAPTGTSSKGSARFPVTKGTYRVRARFKDAAHPTAKYTRWKSIVVK